MNQLCPALNKDNWSPQEDAILVQQQRVYGNVWARIAQFLPGRSPNSVKNRWSWLSRHAVASALALRMIPAVVPRPPPPRIVLPEFARGVDLTAPADFQWQHGSPVIADAGPPPAFSDPTDFGGFFGFRAALSDADGVDDATDRGGRDPENAPADWETWSF
jgi:hypothetical protein